MASFSRKFSNDVVVCQGTLRLGSKNLDRFEVLGTLGEGANGVVFDVAHRVLMQPRAVKVWMRLRHGDRRDKVIQGIAEAQKLAAGDPYWVAIVYDAEEIDGHLFSLMEKLPGHTLGRELELVRDIVPRWFLARGYIDAIEKTTTASQRHGDAHPGNVMVFKEPATGALRIKLLDFGTSLFEGRESSRDRHWRIVFETFRKIVEPFASRDICLNRQPIPYNRREESLRIAYFRDVLFDLSIEAGFHDAVIFPGGDPQR